MFKQGIEMLKIFKNHIMRTSLLDDFMYYENRQKIMLEEKAKMLLKGYGSSLVFPPSGFVNKLNYVLKEDDKITKGRVSDKLKEDVPSSSGQVPANSETISDGRSKQIHADVTTDVISTLKIGSLTINPKETNLKPVADAKVAHLKVEPAGIVTVGTMPIKVNGFPESSSSFLTVGSIPLNPRALQSGNGAD